MSKTIGSSFTSRPRSRRGDHHLVAGAAGRNSRTRQRTHLGQLWSTGQHHPLGVDGTGRGIDPDHAPARGTQPGEGTAFADVDADAR